MKESASKNNRLVAYKNEEFLDSPAARSVRILSEYLEPFDHFRREQIRDTIVFFGSARITEDGPLGQYYRDARELARRITEWSDALPQTTRRFVVCSGGGPGIMEAANRGASDAKGKTIGLNIGLPFEQFPNPYITPELNFEFHYFFMRKFWFSYLAKGIVVFPGGYGSMDELMEVLTLVQTRKLNKKIIIVLYGSQFWKEIINFDALVKHGVVSPEDVNLFEFADDTDTAFRILQEGLMKYHLQPEPETPAMAKSKDPDTPQHVKMIALLRKVGGLEKALFLLVLADIVLFFVPGAAALGALLTVAVAVVGAIVVIRLVVNNLNRILWRLRNRLIVSYLFIAVVPLTLVGVLLAIAGYVLVGQVAIYAVTQELERRVAELPDPLAPSEEFLSNLAPNIGDVFLSDESKPTFSIIFQDHLGGHVPPAVNLFDIEVTWRSPIDFGARHYVLWVVSRPSAVLSTIFLPKMEWGQEILYGAITVGALFLMVQLASIIIGISITRNVTGAVHALYEGTQKVKEGDFAHRIQVHGSDQLAELSGSFNRMTENLERLIEVEKEEERLHSELQIAREVQNQLFPKSALTLQSLQMTGVCHPAQVVSGDYYDYFQLEGSSMVMAIGDVAGKGISAALLMATIQSALRAQLTGATGISTSRIVSLLNKQIFASTSPEKYASFYFGLYDDSTGILNYTNAGHLPPYLIRSGGPEKLDPTGTVVGAFPMSRFEERQVALATGDLLVAYTDGLTEPEDAYGEMFGEDRLLEVVLKYKDAEASEIISRSMEAVVHWTGSTELQDDMTMLIARRTSS